MLYLGKLYIQINFIERCHNRVFYNVSIKLMVENNFQQCNIKLLTMDIRTFFRSKYAVSEIDISSGESEVAFITNERLKVFIKEIQVLYKADLDETKILSEDHNYEPILELQYHIRQHLIENQNRIDFVDKRFRLRDGFPLSMPSLFGLYMMVVSNIDKIDTIKDVMNQFLKRYLVHMGKKFTLGLDISGAIFKATEINEKKLCCCSHKCRLDNMYVIKNSFTDYHVVIGCECIKKNELIDKDVIIEAQKHTYKAMVKEIKKNEIKLKMLEEERVIAEILRNNNKIIMDKEIEKKRITDEKIASFRAFCESENNKLSKERIYIDVPFKMKDGAIELGARWDNDKKLWFIPPLCNKTSILLDKYKKIEDKMIKLNHKTIKKLTFTPIY
jgi:Domain of unknown function (DUF5710)